MKNVIRTIAIVVLFILFCFADSFAQTGNPDLIKNSKPLKDTTIKNTTFKIYVGAKGGRFILVTSKTGNVYKKYLPKG